MDDIRTPGLSQLLQKAINQALGETYVSLPAEVQSYDSASQTVSVQPLLRRDVTDINGNVNSVELPQLVHVPVLFPGGSGFRIMWPLSQGDVVTLIASDRSMDIWQQFGGVVDPLDDRMHSINDVVAIPGLHPDSSPWNADNDGVITIGRDGAAGAFAARVGDAVKVTLGGTPGNGELAALAALLVCGTPGSPCTVLPASTLDIDGVITSGSSSLKVLG